MTSSVPGTSASAVGMTKPSQLPATLFIIVLFVMVCLPLWHLNYKGNVIRIPLVTNSTLPKSRPFVLSMQSSTCNTVTEGHLEKTKSIDYVVKAEPFLTNSTLSNLWNSSHDDYLTLESRIKVPAKVLRKTMETLHNPWSNRVLAKAKCQECIVVGAGACLRGARLGKIIDSFPIVIRMNMAPIEGYETIVGSKTDIRVVYPESAPADTESYLGAGIVVVVPYKSDDILWAAKLVDSSINEVFHFWRSSPLSLPIRPENVLIINPEITESLYNISRVPGSGNKNSRATTGFVAIQMALNLCKSVSVVGFCYDDNPHSYVYYYGTAKTKLQMYIGPHSRSLEPELRAALFHSNFVKLL